MVPQWDRNLDILARWISKINHLTNNLLEINKELGKIVPRRFTNFAETWYHSIPDAECVRIEQNWTTLKKAISEYWMNHHWLEKQKLRANRARCREARHQWESPSECVFCKIKLLRLVYSYTDTETIQAIMEITGTWASIINTEYQKMPREFQNIDNYHKESLKKLEAPSSNHLTFLIGNTLVCASPTEGLMSTLSGGPKILQALRFPRMIIMYLIGKPLTL